MSNESEKPTIRIEHADDGVQIDADVLTRCFRISSDELQQGMRDGSITSRFEKGEGEDDGRIRLTFFSANCRVRITADDSGNILGCNTVDFGKRPLPAAVRNA
ncbi:MAG TPA: DUF6522 family protein [Woeseiaceae bacterium]|nr:DUF6522 family protein [Woeseiaceae bacterium]